MSTWVYLTCRDHEPPLLAADESGQHLYDLPRIRQEVADREQIADANHWWQGGDGDPDGYFRANSARFLAAHARCRIGITDEYGREHPTTDEDDL